MRKNVKQSESVPKEMEFIFNAIIEITNEFCEKKLNEECAKLIRQLAAKLCRKRPSPITGRSIKSWAAGIIHAVGMVNFLFDRNSTPSMNSADLSNYFEISQNTTCGKSKQIRDLLKINQFDPNWTLPSKIEQNPLIWMIEVNGFIIDVRDAPLYIQQEAFALGIIPYIPSDRNN